MALAMANMARQGLAQAGRLGFLETIPMDELSESVQLRAKNLRAERSAGRGTWVQRPAPLDADGILAWCEREKVGVVVADGLNLWLGYELTTKATSCPGALLERHARKELDNLIKVLIALSNTACRVIVCSASLNEGLPPVHESGRLMRELLSDANQKLAAAAQVVCVMDAGLARGIKVPQGWTKNIMPDQSQGVWPQVMLGPEAARMLWPKG
jgi:adenosyl cobinamide kinase/adenosyl cobinamide phosphate guanylyltransferase